MLQAPSHLSRVCGHGHIKKFWLMQTQKESQSCDSKSSSVLFTPSSTSRSGNRASLKGVDSSPWSTPSPLASIPGYGDSPTSAKHPSFTCAETLSSPSLFCKAVLPQSPYSTLSAEGIAQVKNASEPHMKNTSEILAEDTCRAVSEDALRSTSSPRMSPLNVVSEHERKPSLEPSNSLTEEESLSSEGIRRSEDPLSFSADDSTNSITSQGHSPPIQNVKGLYIGAEVHKVNPTLKLGGCSSPARTNIGVRDKVGDEKAVSNIVRLSVPGAAVVSALESGKYYGAGIASRSRDNNVDGSYLAPLMSGLKTCTLCGTTKTPMWRSGPQGPKSLCNACGIRYKKYRTVPGQNGSPEHGVSSLVQISSKALARPLKRKHNSAVPTCEPPRPQKISFKSGVADAVPLHQKKVNWHELAMKREQVEHNRGNLQRWRNTSAPHTCFKKIYGCAPFQSKFKKLAPLDEHRSVSRVFAKDEEEAAVLLMHLSCGLVY